MGVNQQGPPGVGGFFGKGLNSRLWDSVVQEYDNFRLARLAHDLNAGETSMRCFLQQAARWGITSLQLMDPAPASTLDLLAVTDAGLRVHLIPFPLDGAASTGMGVR